MSRGGRGGGAGGGSTAVGEALNAFTFEDGVIDEGELQIAVDSLPDHGELLLNGEGTYYLTEPLRMTGARRIRGLGSRTTFLGKVPLWYTGSTVIVGEVQEVIPHGAPILDDADYSYILSPDDGDLFLNIGVGGGCYPREWDEFWWEFPLVVTSIVAEDNQFFSFQGHFDSPVDPAGIECGLKLAWYFDQERLAVTVRIGGVEHVLPTTSTFHGGDIGTRHMIACGYDGSTVRLFVDGVIEASAAATGQFHTEPWECGIIGGGRTDFGMQSWDTSAHFRCGGFVIGDTCLHVANYAVSWDTRAAAIDGEHFALLCDDANEMQTDLSKVRSGGTGYGYMQMLGADPTFGSKNWVRDLGFKSGDMSWGYSIAVVGLADGCRFERINSSLQEAALYCTGNPFLSVFDGIETSGHRFTSLYSGGVCVFDSIRSQGGHYGSVFIGAGGVFGSIYGFDYTHVGAFFGDSGGSVASISLSDEGTLTEDPLYGVLFRSSLSYNIPLASLFNVQSLDVNTLNATTTPFGIIHNVGCAMSLNIAAPYLDGGGTPPDEFIKFLDPDNADPILVQGYVTLQAVPISSHPEKIITPSGPAGRATLTDASVTITARQAREFDFLGVTLGASRVITLDNELGNGFLIQDGTILEIFANPTFAGNTITIDNHNGADLHVFSAAGSRRFRFSCTTGNWSRMEAA
jgi:hypothetical protein